MISRKFIAAAVVAAVSGSAVVSEAALLTYDLRAVSATNGTVDGPKSVSLNAGPATVTFELYGILDDGALDGNTTNDGINSIGGSVLSGNGGLLGNLSSITPNANFLGNGAGVNQLGNSTLTLDGDADLDVGSNSTATNAAYIKLFSTNTPTIVQGTSLLLGTVTFSVGAGAASESTLVNFRPSALTGGTVASRNYHVFTIDGTSTASAGVLTTQVGVTPGVNINVVPEPTSLALAGLGMLGLVRRRRA